MNSFIVGEGKPVIVLHEWLGDHRNWLPVFDHCTGSGYEFHCVDLPGYGMSRDVSIEPTISTISTQVLDYAVQHNIDSFSLVVHSMSGLIGHHLGIIAPQRIEAILYFCPVPPSGFKASEDIIKKLQLISHDSRALKEAILDRGGHVESEDWVKRKMYIASTASLPETKLSYLDLFLSPIAPSPQKTLFTNATVLTGTIDLPFYRKDSLNEEFSGFYSEFNLVSLDGCGHYPMLQNSLHTSNALLKYLDKK